MSNLAIDAERLWGTLTGTAAGAQALLDAVLDDDSRPFPAA